MSQDEMAKTNAVVDSLCKFKNSVSQRIPAAPTPQGHC